MPQKRQISICLGLAGIAETENPRARRYGAYFELPVMLVSLMALIKWYYAQKGVISDHHGYLFDLLVWGVFVTEVAILSYMVDDKWHYWRCNWLNVLIVISGIGLLWGASLQSAVLRAIRILLLLGLAGHLLRSWRTILAKNQLGYTMLVSMMFVVISGILVSIIDPNIETPVQGIWWAWVTITTVGYGDVVPSSMAGKFFAGILILTGIGLFALLTANISAFLVEKDEDEEQLKIIQKLNEITDRLERIEKKSNNDSSADKR